MSKPRLFRRVIKGSILSTIVIGIMGMLFHYLPRQGVPDIVVAITLTSLAALFYAIRRWEIAEQKLVDEREKLQNAVDSILSDIASHVSEITKAAQRAIGHDDEKVVQAREERIQSKTSAFWSVHFLARALHLKTRPSMSDYVYESPSPLPPDPAFGPQS